MILGFLLGVPLMLGFGNVLYGLVAESVNMVIPMVMNPLHVVISFLVIFAVYQIARWLSGRRLARIPMSEALKAGME